MRVTLRDIANRVNLSHATVSFVLNGRMDVSIPGPTRERVLAAAKEMGYRPNRAAQALVRGRTDMVTLWLPAGQSAHHARVQLDLAELAANDGFKLVSRFFDFGRTSRGNAWEIDDWPVDGILLLDCDAPPLLGPTAPGGIPLVALGTLVDTAFDHVGVDVSTGIREALVHLTSEGCRRIAHLTCRADHPEDAKLAAYLAESRARNLTSELISMPECSRVAAREQVQAYVAAHGKPDAIIAQTDELAIAARRGLADCGLEVPIDVLIVGCDGTEEGEYSTPSISSVLQPQKEMVACAWGLLRSRIEEVGSSAFRGLGADGPATAIHSKILQARLMIRESSVRSK